MKYDACHRTKMAAKPIYGKNPLKSYPGTSGPISMKLVCSIWDSGPSYFVQIDGKVDFCNINFSIGKSENSGFFRKYCNL